MAANGTNTKTRVTKGFMYLAQVCSQEALFLLPANDNMSSMSKELQVFAANSERQHNQGEL